jgi:hypothetical protein
VRSRIVVVGLALIIGLTLATGSVLVVGYAAAAASLLTIVTLLVRKPLRRRFASPIQSPIPRWVDSEVREAA